MSDPLVTLTIDGVEVTVPKGTLLVDAAKQAGIDIPVFCYHPKMEPAGACRMCLVEIGRPARDRASGELIRDEQGKPVIQFGAKLETACTTRVDEGWEVRVNSARAREGRKQIVEFLLTSHPLDCPICDKGGECPLQNLTMEHGPGQSRFLYQDKLHLDKHVPLGELIILDRERCIQCARCIRFQEDIAGDPVIEFSERGRKLEIVTYSDPGFDSYFSGNTTDICPVGALTTVDFRFGARPWELTAVASLCTHCPVGCNTMLNTRREAKSGGREVIKRVMPRQNERVNEIWLCDKGRFGHHYAHSPARLAAPMVRKDGKLVEVDWEEALQAAAQGLRDAEGEVLGIASGRLANEDLWAFRAVVEGLEGTALLEEAMGGGDRVQQVGLGSGSNLGDLGAGDAILVIASDLHEEAPIWWLRVKQAAQRGATLIVANARSTRLDAYAAHQIRYGYGEAPHIALGLLAAVTSDQDLQAYADEALREAAEAFAKAQHSVVFFGREGLDVGGSQALADALAALLQRSGHAGGANNGLVAVWPRPNTQGAWDMGLRPTGEELAVRMARAQAIYLAGADPFGDDPHLVETMPERAFIVVQELFHTASVERAHVVLPAQSYVERDGTYTSGERMVQRFYPAVEVLGQCRPDWKIAVQLGERLGLNLPRSTGALFAQISERVPDYAGLGYRDLARSPQQWPPVGGRDLFFGGTAYKNAQGLGVRLAPAVEREPGLKLQWTEPPSKAEGEGFLLVPVEQLYDGGTTLMPSKLLDPRRAKAKLILSPQDAAKLGAGEGLRAEVRWNGKAYTLPIEAREGVPAGAGLVPRSLGLPVHAPLFAEIWPVK